VKTVNPDKYTPNNSPYGTEKERKYLIKKIQPFVDANTKVDPRSHCNLPGSEILLPLKEGVTSAYRRPYKIPATHLPAVEAQKTKHS
jgi:hypothetical protein